MLLPLLLLVLTAVLAVVLYKQAYERPPNFPPGPPRLPVWGSYWLLLLQDACWLYRSAWAMADRYASKVIGFYLGAFPTVVVHGPELTREMFNRAEFAGRPDTVLTRVRAFGKRRGLFFTDGAFWVEQRRFALRHLRDFGFGRRMACAEDTLRDEVEELLALVRGECDDQEVASRGCVLLPHALHVPFVSLLWSMFAGRRFTRAEHAQVRAVSKAAATFVRNVDPMGGAVSQTPWLRHLAPKATGFHGVKTAGAVLTGLVKAALDEHVKDFNMDEAPRDFIDHYLAQITRDKADGVDCASTFCEEQLQVMGADMLLAAATTTTGTVTFALNWLSRRPALQRRCQAQLDAVVGRARLPSLDDRASLPFVEAVLRETLRRNTMLPLAMPHLTVEDTKLDGYDIPKNTLIFANVNSAHMDKDYWGDPEEFRPDRFLDEKGELLRRDVTMPFGAGKRLCPGETFSRQSMFVVLAALLQNFWFELASDKVTPDCCLPGLTLTPKDTWMRATPRA
ncbi:hypothetical protein R5R35_009363 [Gryllus longicercus]|uniref:Cytochrome P450 n=1 Tax=Gryllus longicercus TaxID=2509291 RepID=A0AAN9YVN5_9ORTH